MKDFETGWNEAKRKFQTNWPELKTEDLEHTHGDKTEIIELLQNKFGLPHEQAVAEVSEVMHDIESSPSLPDTEEQRKIEGDEKPVYPNKMYEEDLPPDIQLNEEE